MRGTYPFIHQAGVDGDLEVIVTPAVNNTLSKVRILLVNQFLVSKLFLLGLDIIKLDIPALVSKVYFPGVTLPQTDFVLNISAPGYQSHTFNDVNIDGDVQLNVTLLTL
ncbi:MAG: hypothetical protein R3B53_00215 [Candidatus Paceibacterota bacterium]